MEILRTYSVNSYIEFAVILPSVTIFTCYGIALALGHVEVSRWRVQGQG